MSTKYTETTDGKFQCVTCDKIFASKSSAGSHHWRAHGQGKAAGTGKKRKGKRRLQRMVSPKATNEDGSEIEAIEKFNKIREESLNRRIKYCPECGHEIPTALVFG